MAILVAGERKVKSHRLIVRGCLSESMENYRGDLEQKFSSEGDFAQGGYLVMSRIDTFDCYYWVLTASIEKRPSCC